jgi:hypothetical protein
MKKRLGAIQSDVEVVGAPRDVDNIIDGVKGHWGIESIGIKGGFGALG